VVVIQRQRVLCANDSAAGLGIRPGMGTATARALAEPQPLRLWERDEAAEERCREQLCCWAYGITPSLHPWRADCLLLEIGSCLTLFRGLAPLLAEVDSGLARRGYSARLGLAETPRAAWLLSHAEQEAMTCERPLAQRLASLPLALLEDEFSTAVNALRRAGLHTLGDILSLPVGFPGLLELFLQEFFFNLAPSTSEVTMLPQIRRLVSPDGEQLSKGEPEAFTCALPVSNLCSEGEGSQDLNGKLLSRVSEIPHVFDHSSDPVGS